VTDRTYPIRAQLGFVLSVTAFPKVVARDGIGLQST
jgi:hypothetical protein